jgi:hypothetical protein
MHIAPLVRQISIRRPKLSSKPSLRAGFHRVVRHKLCMDVIALSALECAEIEARWAGRDACEHHSRLAGRTMGAFNEAQQDTEMGGWGFGHEGSPISGGSTTLSVTGNCLRRAVMKGA